MAFADDFRRINGTRNQSGVRKWFLQLKENMFIGEDNTHAKGDLYSP